MKKKPIFRLWVVLTFAIICLSGVVYYSYKIINWKISVDQNKKIQKKLDKNIKIENGTNNGEEKKYIINFDKFKEINPDTIGYIEVNNTNIKYVVVKGKNNSYYLNHNFEKKWNIAGWIFADYHNKIDGNDKNLIIYGHNMKDGSMFDSLRNIVTKEWYENKDNRKVVFVTEDKTYYYEVFSTYIIKPEDYYINTSFKNNNEFLKFINKLKERSVYDYGVELSEDDKILTLSSCLNAGEKRVVLHAKMIDS